MLNFFKKDNSLNKEYSISKKIVGSSYISVLLLCVVTTIYKACLMYVCMSGILKCYCFIYMVGLVQKVLFHGPRQCVRISYLFWYIMGPGMIQTSGRL